MQWQSGVEVVGMAAQLQGLAALQRTWEWTVCQAAVQELMLLLRLWLLLLAALSVWPPVAAADGAEVQPVGRTGQRRAVQARAKRCLSLLSLRLLPLPLLSQAAAPCLSQLAAAGAAGLAALLVHAGSCAAAGPQTPGHHCTETP